MFVEEVEGHCRGRGALSDKIIKRGKDRDEREFSVIAIKGK